MYRDIVGLAGSEATQRLVERGSPFSDVRERDLQEAMVAVAPDAAQRHLAARNGDAQLPMSQTASLSFRAVVPHFNSRYIGNPDG